MELNVLANLGLDVPLHPDLKPVHREALGKSINFIAHDKELVLLQIDILIDFIDLAALKVGHVDHFYYYGLIIHLFQDARENFLSVHFLHKVREGLSCARGVEFGRGLII